MSIPEPEPYSVPRHDVIALVSGLLVFVASFLPWYRVTFSGEAETGVTGTFNAWHGLAGIGLILLLFSLVVTAAEPYVGEDVSKRPVSAVAALLAALGAVFVVVKSFSLPTVDIPGAHVRLQWGGWLLILLSILQAVITALRVIHRSERETA
jgi:hypothetical protein